ncbi:MAG: superfamily II DNA/RNA helicase [Candidatus Thalassarchaeaceae archaeon]
MVRFSDLGIGPDLVTVLERQGIIEPFEVQMESIPDSMEGRDVCCRAPTGSGKTLAFGLPLLERTKRAKSKRPTSLILTPTRELAEQIRTVLTPLARAIDMNVLSVYGGVAYRNQLRGLEDGAEILVACPGRLLDLIDRRAVSLNDVSIIVLDEADRMADMGFMEPVCDIIEMCSENRQTILFSATLDDDVIDIVEKYQVDPVTIEVGPEEVSMDSMEHLFWNVKNHKRSETAAEIVRKSGRTIIFCRTREGVNRLGDEMFEEQISSTILHGGLNQNQRDKAMRKFSTGRTMVLIATDVASRGIDVEGINCVINYDPPENGKAYKHRSGRTARAGTSGIVISFVPKSKQRAYTRIQNSVGIKCRYVLPQVETLVEHEFELVPPEREERGSKRRGGNNDRRRSSGGNRRGNDRSSGNRRGNDRSSGNSGGNRRGNDRSSGNSGGNSGGNRRGNDRSSGNSGGNRRGNDGPSRNSGGNRRGNDGPSRNSGGNRRGNDGPSRNSGGNRRGNDGPSRNSGGNRQKTNNSSSRKKSEFRS